jgi:hypothetical protein
VLMLAHEISHRVREILHCVEMPSSPSGSLGKPAA